MHLRFLQCLQNLPRMCQDVPGSQAKRHAHMQDVIVAESCNTPPGPVEERNLMAVFKSHQLGRSHINPM